MNSGKMGLPLTKAIPLEPVPGLLPVGPGSLVPVSFLLQLLKLSATHITAKANSLPVCVNCFFMVEIRL